MQVGDQGIYVVCRQGGYICIIRNKQLVPAEVSDIVKKVPADAQFSDEFEFDTIASMLYPNKL